MKRKGEKNILLIASALFLCFMLSTLSVNAVSPDNTQIPVSIHLEGTLPETNEEYVIKIQGENTDTPMPDKGTIDGIHQMTIVGENSTEFPKITYEKPGVYQYTIWQEKGTNRDCAYDDSVYQVKVTITNADSDNGLEATIAIRKKSSNTKLEEIIFENIYITQLPTPVKTGDNGEPVLWMFLAGMSIILAAFTGIKRKSL